MIMKKNSLNDLKRNISKESKIINELDSLFNTLDKAEDTGERNMVKVQIDSLIKALEKTNNNLGTNLRELYIPKKLTPKKVRPSFKTPFISAKSMVPGVKLELKPITTKKPEVSYAKTKPIEMTDIEKETLRRLKKKEKEIIKIKKRKASTYVRVSNKFFSGTSNSFLKKGYFKNMKRNLIRANMNYLTASYISVIFFNTLLSFFIALLLVGFLLFFKLSISIPFVTFAEQNILTRLLSTFWLLIAIPLGTYLFTYFYPFLERKSIEAKINQELPFATIHMSAISESQVEPSNIFKIIIATKEYPTLEKEFIKLLNEINVFGRDFVTALRNVALNSPSKRLSELFDGLATTITSGGDLSEFFDKRAESLLLEYRLEREKQTKSAETFMDIYISVVIAAPMILMLLLIMMRISGLGIALSASMIALIMVLGVSIVNIIFLGFLSLRQRGQ